jgi:hypothetical protein
VSGVQDGLVEVCKGSTADGWRLIRRRKQNDKDLNRPIIAGAGPRLKSSATAAHTSLIAVMPAVSDES